MLVKEDEMVFLDLKGIGESQDSMEQKVSQVHEVRWVLKVLKVLKVHWVSAQMERRPTAFCSPNTARQS